MYSELEIFDWNSLSSYNRLAIGSSVNSYSAGPHIVSIGYAESVGDGCHFGIGLGISISSSFGVMIRDTSQKNYFNMSYKNDVVAEEHITGSTSLLHEMFEVKVMVTPLGIGMV